MQRVSRVGLVAVEEMLAIDHRLAARRDRRAHAVADAVEVLLQRATERDMDVIVPALGDKHDRVGVGRQQTRDAGIVGDRAPSALGHAEGAEFGALGWFALKELGVERIGAGIAALDIIDAEFVQHRGDVALVVEAEIDAGRQRAVA